MMSKTIKQIADDLGVSKTAVRKYMTLDFRKKYVQTDENGILRINKEGENLLQKLRKQPQTPQTKTAETGENQSLQAVVDTQKETIGLLKGQLAAKDEQIRAHQEQITALQAELERERQHSRDQSDKLAALSETVGNSLQQLTTGQTADKNKQLVDTMLQAQQSIVPSKRHWWQRKQKG